MGTMDIESLSPGRLARLLRMDVGSGWSEADGVVALRHQLDAPLLPDLLATDDIDPTELEEYLLQCGEIPRFGTYLTAASPSLTLLSAIKRFGKQASVNPANPLSKGGASVLYFAAVAAAMVRLQISITSMSPSQMRDGFKWATAQAGAEELYSLFKEALVSLDATRERLTANELTCKV